MPRNDSDENQPDNFVSYDSLKNYTVATGSLTLVINTSLYFYKIIKGSDMPNVLLISIALLLSILYIVSFFKRKKDVAMPKYIWITFLNSLMLFTSISGVNGMLDSARQAIDTQPTQSPQSFIDRKHFPRLETSVGEFFKHLIFPTHGWFNRGEAELSKTKEIVESTIASIETTQKLTDTLISQKARDINTIDTLYKAIDTLHIHYMKALELLQRADSNIRTLENPGKLRKIVHDVTVEVTRTAPKIETDHLLHHHQHQQEQQEQIQQLQQQQQMLRQQRQRLQRRASYDFTELN